MSAGERKALLRRSGSLCPPAGLTEEERERCSLAAQDALLEAYPIRAGMKVALYAAASGEVGTGRIAQRCREAGATAYYPKTFEGARMAFYSPEDGRGWIRGRYGIAEPDVPPGAEGLRDGFDLVVVPGMAFDARGGRLGKGAGYYDRFLSGLGEASRLVGLAFSWQIVPEVPVDSWDVSMEAVVTEKGVLRVPERDPVFGT